MLAFLANRTSNHLLQCLRCANALVQQLARGLEEQHVVLASSCFPCVHHSPTGAWDSLQPLPWRAYAAATTITASQRALAMAKLQQMADEHQDLLHKLTGEQPACPPHVCSGGIVSVHRHRSCAPKQQFMCTTHLAEASTAGNGDLIQQYSKQAAQLEPVAELFGRLKQLQAEVRPLPARMSFEHLGVMLGLGMYSCCKQCWLAGWALGVCKRERVLLAGSYLNVERGAAQCLLSSTHTLVLNVSCSKQALLSWQPRRQMRSYGSWPWRSRRP